MTEFSFSLSEKADAADREAKYRERVYPRWIESGRMKQDFADKQIRLMREIAKEYRLAAEAEAQKGRLL
ncbi:hypothetical protein [Bosea sp. BK604]|uniref:hypothetical protein n=1 Tax=Bosea sp. BK604 TaxID=2512180 RepID=UPI00104EA59B|nr:hypothetical protein [Bosea sp. BK604]TCR64661.1 hypothetical protein EV560_106126 [Bosea sp. BK604]